MGEVADAEALIQLLWRPSTRVGRTGATISSIVNEAIEIADARGLAAVTMRGLAEQVGVGVMTLYGFVPGRTELLELMVDRVTGSTYPEGAGPARDRDWRDGAHEMARRIFDHGVEHAWLGEVVPARPVLGPGVCRTYEQELAVFEGIGLSDVEMDHAVTVVRGMASHAARWQSALDAARGAETDAQWWERLGPRLQGAMAGEDLPLSSRVGESVSSAGDPWGTVQFGLLTLLETLSTRVEVGR